MFHSIVEYYAEHEGYRCGYCKKPNTNYSHGMWAHALTVTDYQDLIDRGWRRSGKYCYKPTMEVTCCPMYTIRCKALEFKPSKSQKKVLKRFNNILSGDSKQGDGEMTGKMSTAGSVEDLQGAEGGGEEYVEGQRPQNNINIHDMKNINNMVQDAKPEGSRGSHEKNTRKIDDEILQVVTHLDNDKKTESKEAAGPDPTKPPCKKAKQIRRERRLEKLKEKGMAVSVTDNSKNKEKQIEDFIEELPDSVKNRLQIKLVRTCPPGDDWKATSKATLEVYVKYQTIIHNDKPHKLTDDKFKDFLVESPLLEEYKGSGPECGYGSFHQQYWLDGKLIAVGVIDILPKCVSSVYFFYDPDYRNLTLGTYGALREIGFTRHLNKQSSDIQYYYMGYYIHSCPKMIYKGKFSPSDLLCPETYIWFPLKDCISKLDASPYSRLNPDIDSLDANNAVENDINFIKIWRSGSVMFYSIYQKQFGHKRDNELLEFARLVGKKSAKNLIVAI